MEVHKQLGCGFLEPVYQEALALEFSKRAILFYREVTLPIFYKEVRLETPTGLISFARKMSRLN